MATRATSTTEIAYSSTESAERTIYRRAVEAAVWGMPIVAFEAMRQAFLRDAGAQYNDIVYFSKQADWKFQVTTPNTSSWYVYLAINLKDGPVVIDVPPASGAGLFGSMNDAWQIPRADVGPHGSDQGKGGKYLLLPPEYKETVPEGYFPIQFNTHNGYSILRAIPATTAPEDVAKAIELVKHLRMYPLSQAADPPEQRYIDMAGKLFDGVARFDDTFYGHLARIVNDEPVQTRDMLAMGQLRSIGIEKGKPFEPDAATRETLRKAILEAHDGFLRSLEKLPRYFDGEQWTMAVAPFGRNSKFTFQSEDRFELDERAAFFFLGCAPPVTPGATFYLMGARDSSGAPLEGSSNYRLHVPPNVPAKQFWATTVYDLDEANLIRETPKPEVNSYQNLQTNDDGSVDVYYGQKAPEGKDSNWVYTAPAKKWITLFRLYGPDKPIHEKTWVLPDIERIN